MSSSVPPETTTVSFGRASLGFLACLALLLGLALGLGS